MRLALALVASYAIACHGGAAEAGSAGTAYSVNPAGTWLKVDSAIGDIAAAPSSVSLASLGVGPGDTIKLRAQGSYSNGKGKPDGTDRAMIAVFRTGSTPVAPASPRPSQVKTPPSCAAHVKNDIPEDFRVSSGWTTVRVPAGANNIAFSTLDCHFVDNSDPNGDFKVVIATP